VNRVVSAVKATYYFFAGDAIILCAVLLAFLLGFVLVHAVHAPNPLVAVVFIALIVGGLVLTLRRELLAH
jgi:hypothetical protein